MMMAQNKEQIIADMLTNGLLSDEDAERYWADKSVSADEMEEIKRLILLCQKRAESKSKSYSLEEADKMIREKYFSKQSTESTIDDTEYTKQLIQLCDNNQKYIDTGQTRPIEELFNEVEEKYFSEQSGESTINDATYRQQTLKLIEKSEKDFEEGNSISIEDYSGELEERYKNKISENRKEEIIADMLDNGLLSKEDAKRYLADKSVSADEMKYIGQLILLCKKNQEEVKAGRVYSVEDLINNLKRRYSLNNSTDETITDDTLYRKQLLMLVNKAKQQVKEGKYMPADEFFDSLEKRTIKDIVLEKLLKNNDITQEEYEKYMSDDNFSDADAMKRKGIEDIIHRGEEDLKNGNVESWEDTLKKIQEARKRILADDDEAIRNCEDDIKNGRIHPFEETVKRFKGEYTPKVQTLKLLLDRGDITQEEYEKYLSDNNFTDADAMEMKEIEDIIREGDEDMKNGNYSPFEESWKRILAYDDEAIRDCEDEAIERIKKE